MAWLDYQSNVDPEGVHQPVANLSTTTTLTDHTGMFTTKIALVVPVYQYQSYDIWDCVNFRTCLYFDSFAEGNLRPAFTDQVIFVIEKDTDGSDLNKQKIEWWRSDVDSYSQGEGLSQYSPMGSTEEDRSFWALGALTFGVGLFLEPLSVATDLIGVAQAFLGGGLVDDCIDAGYEDLEADSYWGSGIGDHPSPSRQYCFNIARWIQNATNPSSFYGLKIWAKVSLDPLYNPYDVLDIWMGPIYLRIHHSHALSISATSGGITEPYPGTRHYKEGTSVTVTAYAYSGYSFHHWVLDGATVYDNPITVTMNSDHTVKAYFESGGGDFYTLTISAGYGGTTSPAPGTYTRDYGTTVRVTALGGWPSPPYKFDYWVLDGARRSENPIWVTMNSDHTLKAYFKYSGGGGPPCPTLFAWNGSDYVDLGVIDIHADGDVVREVSVPSESVGVNHHEARFRLREGWEGLTYSHSEIDQVKLHAVDSDGNWRLCPLVNATHSELGNVLPQLLLSDDTRIDLYLLETIDLKFVVPCQTDEIQEFAFVIEGCNMLKV